MLWAQNIATIYVAPISNGVATDASMVVNVVMTSNPIRRKQKATRKNTKQTQTKNTIHTIQRQQDAFTYDDSIQAHNNDTITIQQYTIMRQTTYNNILQQHQVIQNIHGDIQLDGRGRKKGKQR